MDSLNRNRQGELKHRVTEDTEQSAASNQVNHFMVLVRVSVKSPNFGAEQCKRLDFSHQTHVNQKAD
jgi:hypothetical protein